jgi:hypothetical protein
MAELKPVRFSLDWLNQRSMLLSWCSMRLRRRPTASFAS